MRITLSFSGDFDETDRERLADVLSYEHDAEVANKGIILPAKGSRLVTCTVEDVPPSHPELSLRHGLYTDILLTVLRYLRYGDVLVRHPNPLGPATRIFQ
jgi:hypothetical protein